MPGSFILLDGEDGYKVLRSQGEVIMRWEPAQILLPPWINFQSIDH